MKTSLDDGYASYKAFESDAMEIFRVGNKEMIAEFNQILDKRSIAHEIYKDAVAFHGSDKFTYGPKFMKGEVLAAHNANLASKRSFMKETLKLIRKYEPFLKEKNASYNKKIQHITKRSAYDGKEERF